MAGPRTVQVRATRSAGANIAQKLNPGFQQSPLASITGNPTVLRGPGDQVVRQLQTGGTASPFGQDSDLARTAQQLLDPTLTGQQAGLQRTLQRGAAGRGLVGGAVNATLGAQENAFLAGNRIEALQSLSGALGARVGELSESLDPFFGLVGGSITDLFNQPGSQVDFLKFREALADRNLQSDVSGSLFGGLEALGKGNLVQEALFQQLGAEGQGIKGIENTQENQELLAAIRQFLDPKLSRAQLNDPRAHVDPTRDFDRATNQLLGGARLAQFFQEQIGGFNNQFLEMQALAQGLGALEGGDRKAAHAKVLEQDFSRFSGLLQATGILPPGGQPDPNAVQNLVDSTNVSSFLQGATSAQEQLTAPVRPLGVGGRVPRTRIRKVAI
jgi:hypothetical protein